MSRDSRNVVRGRFQKSDSEAITALKVLMVAVRALFFEIDAAQIRPDENEQFYRAVCEVHKALDLARDAVTEEHISKDQS